MDDNKIIIVKKAKKHHHGHHGGSWKVAYADFVTAMMAFFPGDVDRRHGVQGAKDLVEGYFNNPVGFPSGVRGRPVDPGVSGDDADTDGHDPHAGLHPSCRRATLQRRS